MLYLDNTTISDFRTCMRMGYYKHVRGWRPADPAPPLIFGGAWHDAMDVVWSRLCNNASARIEAVQEEAFTAFLKNWQEAGAPYPIPMVSKRYWGDRCPDTAVAMLAGYIKKRRASLERMEMLYAEEPFVVPLMDGIAYTGLRDKLVRYRSDNFIVEHKTTTWGSKGGFRDLWSETWSPNSQVDGYIYSAKLAYPHLQTSVWIDGALVHPAHNVFEFIPVRRSSANIDGWLWETKYWAGMIRQNWAAERPVEAPYLAAFPKNTGSCIQYNRLCPYLHVCKNHANPEAVGTPAGMEVKFWDPIPKAMKEEFETCQSPATR